MSKEIDLKIQVDPVTRDTSFEMLGSSYRLRFDFAALYEFYKSMGINPIVEPVGSDPAKIAALLFVGLLRHHPEIETDTVKSWFSSGPMAHALFELTFSGLRAQLPDPDPQAVAADPPSA